LLSIERKERILGEMPEFRKAERVCRVREAVTSQSETVSAENSLGRVAALTHCSCPPAVPVVVSGERIDENAIKCFEYYGIKEIKVIKGTDLK
jgi:arginine/lysine/ornithine decarboxylase